MPIDTPTFSVLMTAYNSERFIARALDCLLGQTCPDWEVVVVDDGSTDKTPEILAGYAAKDKRIRVFRQENSGNVAACRPAFEESRGRWICNLASDDLFDVNKLNVHSAWFRLHPECQFFYTLFWLFDESRRIETDYLVPIPERQWQVLSTFNTNLIHANSACVSREAFEWADGFDGSFPFNGDYDLWLRLLSRYPAVYIPERTCGTRLHMDANSIANKSACFYDAARSGIKFLNGHSFRQLFPLMDLNQPEQARLAAVNTLSVAINHTAYLYQLGPHPALILRLLEWAWRDCPAEAAKTVQQIIKEVLAQECASTRFGQMWQAALSICQSGMIPAYSPVDVLSQVVLPSLRVVAGRNDEAERELRKYIQRIWPEVKDAK